MNKPMKKFTVNVRWLLLLVVCLIGSVQTEAFTSRDMRQPMTMLVLPADLVLHQ